MLPFFRMTGLAVGAPLLAVACNEGPPPAAPSNVALSGDAGTPTTAPTTTTTTTTAPTTPRTGKQHLSLATRKSAPNRSGVVDGLTITVEEVVEKYLNTGGTAMRVKLTLSEASARETVSITGGETLSWHGYDIAYSPAGWRDTVELDISRSVP